MFDVNTGKLLDWERQMTDPTSHQRGRPTETRQQISENNLRTESNIWSQVPEWAWNLDILTDRPSVVMWLRLWLQLQAQISPPRHTDWLSVIMWLQLKLHQISHLCRSRLKYLHRSPESRKRQQKGNPVPGGINGPPCSWGIWMRGPRLPGWGSLRWDSTVWLWFLHA
jgi:hypothetical protein